LNLYGSTANAFEGHHEELAAICHGWAPGVVANADLTFATRLEAMATPERMEEQDLVDQAIGMLAASLELDAADAAERLRRAAARADLSEAKVARVVIKVLSDS
jgi:AmiR/NasT family two-component response regulator